MIKEELLLQLLDDSNQMIQIIDAKTFEIIYANEFYKKVAKDNSRDFKNKTCYKYLMGSDSQCSFCALRNIGNNDSIATSHISHDKYYDVSFKRINIDGRECFIEYAFDITDKKRNKIIYTNRISNLIASVSDAKGLFHLDLTADRCISVAGLPDPMVNLLKPLNVDSIIKQLSTDIPNYKDDDIIFNSFNREALLRANGRGELGVEKEIITTDNNGNTIFVKIIAKFVDNPVDGNLECILYGVDLSKEIELKNKLEEAYKIQNDQSVEITKLYDIIKKTQDQAIKDFMDLFIQNGDKNIRVNALLEKVSAYFNADRSYIFELDDSNCFVNNTYEYCSNGITHEIDNLQSIPFENLQTLFDRLKKEGLVPIIKNEELNKDNPFVYDLLDKQKVNSIIVAPFIVSGSIIGFMGVDNPRCNTEQELFLNVASSLLNHEIFLIRDSVKKDEYKKTLENQKRELEESLDVIQSLAKPYNSIYLLDLKTHEFTQIGTSYHRVRKIVGGGGNSVMAFDTICRLIIAKDFVEQFREFVDVFTLSERLRNKNWISLQFQSNDERWAEGLFIASHRDSEGNCTKAIWAVRGINADKKRELKYQKDLEAHIHEITDLNSSLKEYNDIIANAGLGIWHIILKDGFKPRMQVNEKMSELLGITNPRITEEEIYIGWYDKILDESIPIVINFIHDTINGIPSEIIYKWMHPAKGAIYVRCSGTGIEKPDGTKVISGYHSDVTSIVVEDLKQKEALENINASLTDQIDIVGGLSNAYFSVYRANVDDNTFIPIKDIPTVERLLNGESRIDEVFKKYIPAGIALEDQMKMYEFTDYTTLSERLKDKNAITLEFHASTKEYEWCRASWIASKWDSNGRPYGFLYVVEDITSSLYERKKQELELENARKQAEEANRAKTAFLFNMSHDIRTPMNAIIGFTNLMEKNHDNQEKCLDYLHKVQNASNFLLSLVNNVLEMARIESGKASLDETTCEVLRVANELAMMFEDKITAKNLTFVKEFNVKHDYVFSDESKIREIYLNILSNAIKYTPNGGVVTMKLDELDSPKQDYVTLQCKITDTGIGMSKEFIPHLFEDFSRAHTVTESKIEGTGLGMPIVKRLVELMGGSITVESELGKGTTFTVTLTHKISSKDAYEIKDVGPTDNAIFKGKRILLAEDNELNAEIAIEILSANGFIVELAQDGIICIDMLQKSADKYYDLILMDIQMPNMDGYKATKIIRRMPDENKRNIPIIAMTANAFEEDKINALAAGMNGHLAKPIVVPKLIEELEKALKNK